MLVLKIARGIYINVIHVFIECLEETKHNIIHSEHNHYILLFLCAVYLSSPLLGPTLLVGELLALGFSQTASHDKLCHGAYLYFIGLYC